MDEDILMSDFVASQPGHQSFSAQTPVDAQPSESSKIGINHLPVPHVAKATKLRPILASEWSQVERLLRHLYIEKDQTLKAVQRYLREKHSLIVSEKQLTRKFSEWNLKKNFKRGERKALIYEYRVTQDNQWAREGYGKVTAKKLIRWEKEMASSSKPNIYQCHDENSGVSTSVLNEREEAKAIRASDQMELLPTDTDSTSESVDNLEKDPTILIAQLFAKLDLDVPADINSFYVEVEPIEETTASDNDLVPLASIHTSVPFGRRTCTTVTTQPSAPNSRLEFVANQQGSPFRWANMDVMFPTGLWVQPSPYNELYPFTTDSQNVQIGSISSKDENLESMFSAFFSSSDSKLEERLCKVEKLRQLCQPNHAGLINEMWEVVRIYLEKEDSPKVEYWCRHLAQCTLSPDTALYSLLIRSRLVLYSAISDQGKHQEAKKEHQFVHQLVLGSSIYDEKTVRLSLLIGAKIADDLREKENSESWYRQLAQLTITTYGPRSEDTIWALRCLSKAMLNQGRYSESEELLWILVDLAKTNLKSTDRAMTKVTCSLAEVLFKQNQFEDAKILWKRSLEIAETNWGREDSIALRAETGLALTLKSQKRVIESERLLRRNVKTLLKVRGENSLTASNSMKYLGSLMMENGRYEDAVIWFEKCTKIRLLRLGPTDKSAFSAFACLRECYLLMGRYNDALTSGQELLEEVKRVSGPDHKYVHRLEGRLKDIAAENGM